MGLLSALLGLIAWPFRAFTSLIGFMNKASDREAGAQAQQAEDLRVGLKVREAIDKAEVNAPNNLHSLADEIRKER